MKKTSLLLFTALFLITSCATTKLSSPTSLQELPVPPGTKKIADNLYIDQAEIRNLDYLEFLHWTSSTFGKNSAEYQQALPDPKVWAKVNANYAKLDSVYSTHPDFRLQIVLGVSNQQAKLFSKWRSDRVMEFMLIRDKVIKYETVSTKESMFTIEKYFTGKYRNLQPSPYLLFYPEYRLLDSTENTSTGFKTICVYKKWE